MDQQDIKEGWVGQPKWLLQALWERGYTNICELDMYSGDDKKTKRRIWKSETRIWEICIMYLDGEMHRLVGGTECNGDAVPQVVWKGKTWPTTLDLPHVSLWMCRGGGCSIAGGWGKDKEIPLTQRI